MSPIRIALVLLSAYALLTTAGFSVESGKTGEVTPCQSEIREVISKAGYNGPLRMLRNDTQAFVLDALREKNLIFYYIKEGGSFKDESGRSWTLLGSPHSGAWRVFVDPESCRVFRMSGFGGAHDFSELADYIGDTVNRNDASTVAQNFLELTYSPGGSVIRNKFEALQFVEASFYGRNGEEGVYTCLRPWLTENYRKIEGKIADPKVEERKEGFIIKLALGIPASIGGDRQTIEIRDLKISVSKRGNAEILDDELLMSVDLKLCRG